MAFKGITFAGQNVTPKNDGGLYMAHYGDGVLWGCGMTLSGDDLVIQSGEFIAGGRVCQVDGTTNIDLSDRTISNGYIQVVMDFDISQPEGSQWNIHRPLYENPSSPSFGALTQDNINGSDTLYQVELAIIQVSTGNLTNIYSTAGVSILRTGSQYIGSLEGNDNSLFLIGNGNTIGLRPNGDGTGEVYWDTTGQQVGGHYGFSNRAGSGSFSGNTWTTLYTNSIARGTWILYAQATFTNTSALTCNVVIGRTGYGGNPNDDSIISRQAMMTSGARTRAGINTSCIIFPADFDAMGVLSMTVGMYVNFSASCTRDGVSFCGVRLG